MTGHHHGRLINTALPPKQMHSFLPTLKVINVKNEVSEHLLTQRNVFIHKCQCVSLLSAKLKVDLAAPGPV